MQYKLKSGQINFENVNQPGAYSCVVIRDGQIHNLTDDLKKLLLNAINGENTQKEYVDLDSMF